MADVGGIILAIGAATALNCIYDVQTKTGNPVVTGIAGAATGTVLVVIGSATGEWELPEALAIAFLVGSIFLHGAKIAGIGTALASKPSASSNAGGSTGNGYSGGGGGGGGGGGR